MKLSLFLVISVFCLIPVAGFAAFGDPATTNEESISKIDIQNAGDPYYYFTSADGNWSSPDCPNAGRAYINGNDAGAKEMLSVALMAKATNKKVQFKGVCGNGASSDAYIYIKFMTLVE